MAVKFVETPEQGAIVSRCVSAIGENDNAFCALCVAPAGGGKSSLAGNLFQKVEENFPEKKIAYFVFNSFMKEEMSRRGYASGTNNTEYFTYHSFLLQHALKNDKIKERFLDASGELIIDFAKQGYSKEEALRTCSFLLNSQDEKYSSFLLKALNDWHNTDLDIEEYTEDVYNKIYGDTDGYVPDSYLDIKNSLDSFETLLMNSSERLLSVGNKNTSPLPPNELFKLFIKEGIGHITSANKMSHSAYYKSVFDIATKEGIDLFEGFDFLVVDEAQDMDKLFKKLVELSGKPLLIIGDSAQSIYGFRGAVDMLSSLERPHEKFGLSYSFRYENDIAQLGHQILLEKDTTPDIHTTGKYINKIRNIDTSISSINEMVQKIDARVDKRLWLCERLEGLRPEEMKTKELRKFLAQEKVAFISRNNDTLIQTLFEALPIIRSLDKGDHFHISLTDSVSEDFKKIKLGDFGYKTNKRISELIGEPYIKWKKGKSLEQLLENHDVRSALFDNGKVSFLLDESKYENFKYLLEQLSSRKEDSISKTDKNSNFVFTTVHGAKGKEFSEVFLGWDILKNNSEGVIQQEEYNVAYVAVTRTKGNLSFIENNMNTEPHYLYEFASSCKSEIENNLLVDYTYSFPSDVEMRISHLKYGQKELYQHTFTDKAKNELSLFMLDEPIKMGMCGYICDDSRGVIKFRDSDRKSRVVSFEGEEIYDENIARKLDYYYGVGKGDFSSKKKASEKNKGERKITAPPSLK